MTKKEIIYQKLKESKKYKYLCHDTLDRTAGWAASRYDSKKAVKAAKNKLHQVYGAFFETLNLNKIKKRLEVLTPVSEIDNIKQAALEIMKFHSSTRERIPLLESFYPELFSKIGRPKKILDLACGLNPFSLPWMGLESEARYIGFDIDKRLTSMINTFFKYLNRPCRVECADILVSTLGSGSEADVVFILKTLPSLEQQEKGVGERLLKSLPAGHIVISFPARSLTGKERGMENYYHEYILDLINRLSFNYFKLEYLTEIFYILNR